MIRTSLASMTTCLVSWTAPDGMGWTAICFASLFATIICAVFDARQMTRSRPPRSEWTDLSLSNSN